MRRVGHVAARAKVLSYEPADLNLCMRPQSRVRAWLRVELDIRTRAAWLRRDGSRLFSASQFYS